MSLGLIWAQAHGGVIGIDNALPWHLPEDSAHFRRTTLGTPVIMGRATWQSLPERFRPLPGRENIVVSRTLASLDGATVVGSVEDALTLVAGRDAWVIGGAQVYTHALPHADHAVVTEIDLAVPGDAFAPALGQGWELVAVEPGPTAGQHPGAGEDGIGIQWHTSSTGLRYRFLTYARRTA